MIQHKQRATISAENIKAFTLARVLLLRIIKQNRELEKREAAGVGQGDEAAVDSLLSEIDSSD